MLDYSFLDLLNYLTENHLNQWQRIDHRFSLNLGVFDINRGQYGD